MAQFVFQSTDEQSTDTLGQKLASALPKSAVVALCGPLGAGKTRLVQAVAAALGVDRTLVASPTFVLIHEYLGSRPIFHFDAYRLKDEDEFSALAPDEYFEAGGLCFVEWADRVRDCLPGDYLEIVIEPTGEQSRTFTISSHGERLKPVITALMADKLGKI